MLMNFRVGGVIADVTVNADASQAVVKLLQDDTEVDRRTVILNGVGVNDLRAFVRGVLGAGKFPKCPDPNCPGCGEIVLTPHRCNPCQP